jgi:hypothetical protein
MVQSQSRGLVEWLKKNAFLASMKSRAEIPVPPKSKTRQKTNKSQFGQKVGETLSQKYPT